jgi:hypothetical protein
MRRGDPDPRAAWNAVQRLAHGSTLGLAEDLAEVLAALRPALADLAGERLAGGLGFAEGAALEAIEQAKEAARLRKQFESGALCAVYLSHSGEGCRHFVGYLPADREGYSAMRGLRSRQWPDALLAGIRAEWLACDEGDVAIWVEDRDGREVMRHCYEASR